MNIKRTRFNFILLKFSQSILIFMIAALTAILCYDKPYKAILLLPFSYMIINLFYNNQISKKDKYTGGFIHRAALVVIFIRYAITPLSIAITGEFYSSRANTSSDSISFAVLLMMFELVSVYITLFVARLYYSKRLNRTIPESVKGLNHKVVLAVFSLLALIIILAVEPNLLIPSNFLVLTEDYSRVQLDIAYDGLYSSLAQLVKPVIFLLLLSNLKKKYDKNKNDMYIWFSFFLVVFFMGLYTGTQRWELVFAGIIGLYLLKVSYREIPKVLVVGIIAIMSIGFFSASLYKFSWAVQSSINPLKDVTIEMLGMFQNYFSGPRVVANSIEMQSIYGNNITLVTFINDFIGSIPILSRYVDQSNRINVYFNMYHNIHNNAFIIPMLGIGYSYFPIFPPIFTVICQWFLVKLDYKLETSKSIEYRYLYLYLGLYLAMSLGFNTQIVFAKFLIPFLPLLFIFKVNELICLKRKTANEPHNLHIPNGKVKL